MLKQVGTLLCCGALLTGCSSIMGPPDPRPPDPAPQPLPAVKQIIANSTDVLFAATANPKNVAISDLRRFDGTVRLGRTAPGRGGWCCSAACFEQAVGRGALDRALRHSLTTTELAGLRATLCN